MNLHATAMFRLELPITKIGRLPFTVGDAWKTAKDLPILGIQIMLQDIAQYIFTIF